MKKNYYFSPKEIALEDVYVGGIKIEAMVPLTIVNIHYTFNAELGQIDVIYLTDVEDNIAELSQIDANCLTYVEDNIIEFIYSEYGNTHHILDGANMYKQRVSILKAVLGDNTITTADERISGKNIINEFGKSINDKKVYGFLSLDENGQYYLSGILGEGVDPEFAYFPAIENQKFMLGESIKASHASIPQPPQPGDGNN